MDPTGTGEAHVTERLRHVARAVRLDTRGRGAVADRKATTRSGDELAERIAERALVMPAVT